MTPRDIGRLVGVHPRLKAAVVEIIGGFAANGIILFVVEGVRTTARQEQLYAEGRTVLGTIVTYKDGVTHRSNHQPHADGLGYAVDLAFAPFGAIQDPFDPRRPWEAYGEAAEARGLIWGGRWSMRDLPHIELPDTTAGVLKA